MKKNRRKKKNQSRELVMLAVMTSLCVVANSICSHTIPLHAGTSLVILTGISLGCLPGLIVGMLARFICNFFDGQGPWTLWQMLSWGILGLLSGCCFQPIKRETLLQRQRRKKMDPKQMGLQFVESCSILIGIGMGLAAGCLEVMLHGGEIKEMLGWRLYAYGALGIILGCLFQGKRLPAKRLFLAIYTFLVVFVIYGGIMNFATMFMQYMISPVDNPMNLKALCALYITGVPYDFSHAAGAAICNFFIGESLLQKLERIQNKYNWKGLEY